MMELDMSITLVKGGWMVMYGYRADSPGWITAPT